MPERSIMNLMKSDNLDVLLLENRVFSNVVFEDFAICPTIGQSVTVSSVHFENCRVSPGTCMIRAKTLIKDVTFTNFRCGDAMHISSEVHLDRLRIIGKKYPRMVWVRPENERSTVRLENTDVEFLLDISEFYGEVSITGIPTEKCIRDSSRHVVVHVDPWKSVDWKSLGISGLSYWKLMAKKAAVENSPAGIFSMPPKNSRNYEKSVHELQILRQAGIAE